MSTVRHVTVVENILKANDYLARELKSEWDRSGTFVVNIMSSPGAGKTSLLEATLPLIGPRGRPLVLVGDIETARDAERIEALGFETVQITTGGT